VEIHIHITQNTLGGTLFRRNAFAIFTDSRLETRRIAVPDRWVAQLTGVCTPWVRADMDVDSVASIVVDAGNKGSLALAKHHLQICSQSRWVGQHSRVGRGICTHSTSLAGGGTVFYRMWMQVSTNWKPLRSPLTNKSGKLWRKL
jgi:hypothetical protein